MYEVGTSAIFTPSPYFQFLTLPILDTVSFIPAQALPDPDLNLIHDSHELTGRNMKKTDVIGRSAIATTPIFPISHLAPPGYTVFLYLSKLYLALISPLYMIATHWAADWKRDQSFSAAPSTSPCRCSWWSGSPSSSWRVCCSHEVIQHSPRTSSSPSRPSLMSRGSKRVEKGVVMEVLLPPSASALSWASVVPVLLALVRLFPHL